MNNDLKAMTDAQLDAEAKALRGMAYTASQARKAGAFGRIDRGLPGARLPAQGGAIDPLNPHFQPGI